MVGAASWGSKDLPTREVQFSALTSVGRWQRSEPGPLRSVKKEFLHIPLYKTMPQTFKYCFFLFFFLISISISLRSSAGCVPSTTGYVGTPSIGAPLILQKNPKHPRVLKKKKAPLKAAEAPYPPLEETLVRRQTLTTSVPLLPPAENGVHSYKFPTVKSPLVSPPHSANNSL